MYRTHFPKLTVLPGSEIIVGRDKRNCHKLTDLDGRKNQFMALGTNLVKHSKAVRATKVRLEKFIGLSLENLRWKIFRLLIAFLIFKFLSLDCSKADREKRKSLEEQVQQLILDNEVNCVKIENLDNQVAYLDSMLNAERMKVSSLGTL